MKNNKKGAIDANREYINQKKQSQLNKDILSRYLLNK